MNKFLLSTLLASTVMFSGVVKASENDMPPPPFPAHEQVELEKHHKGFDKDFHEKMAKKMAEDLGLTEAQQAQAKQIREEGVKKIKPLMDEMKALREKLDKERRANMEEFEKILTPDQKKKFEDMKAKGPFGKDGKIFRKNHKGFPKHKMMKGMHKATKADLPKE